MVRRARSWKSLSRIVAPLQSIPLEAPLRDFYLSLDAFAPHFAHSIERLVVAKENMGDCASVRSSGAFESDVFERSASIVGTDTSHATLGDHFDGGRPTGSADPA